MRKAFKMKLYAGFIEEYKRRHDHIWSEMKKMIHQYGGSNYSIFFDEQSDSLFAYIEIADEALWKCSSETEICKQWWEFMSDIMETNPDNSPVSVDLLPVFHLD